jgi:transcriptional antiterminator
MREYIEPDGTFSPATQLNHELIQLSKLVVLYPDLTIKELAHRMTATERQVIKMLKLLEK